MDRGDNVQMVIGDVREAVDANGYCVVQTTVCKGDAVQFVLDVGRSLGELYVPPGCEPEAPIIRTAPTRASRAAPFDRPAPIGWHGDFTTHRDRPELSISFVTQPDPRGHSIGAWRLASTARVIGALRTNEAGRASLEFLMKEALPFSYTDTEPPQLFRVIEAQRDGRPGLRFYRPSLRRGCLAAFGAVPPRIDFALQTLEQAADGVGEVVPTQEGSLLIASNWFALHDRVHQTVSRQLPNREALLCFIARAHR
jgi:hypothetical protein